MLVHVEPSVADVLLRPQHAPSGVERGRVGVPDADHLFPGQRVPLAVAVHHPVAQHHASFEDRIGAAGVHQVQRVRHGHPHAVAHLDITRHLEPVRLAHRDVMVGRDQQHLAQAVNHVRRVQQQLDRVVVKHHLIHRAVPQPPSGHHLELEAGDAVADGPRGHRCRAAVVVVEQRVSGGQLRVLQVPQVAAGRMERDRRRGAHELLVSGQLAALVGLLHGDAEAGDLGAKAHSWLPLRGSRAQTRACAY